MSTIFSRSYAENLLRLSARARAETQDKTPTSNRGEEFAHALGDLEKSPEILKETAEIAPAETKSQAPNNVLSNLLDGERSALNVSSIATAYPDPTPELASILGEGSVKIPELNVKTTVTPPAPVVSNSAPATPVIMGFKRVAPSAQDVVDQYARQDIKSIVRQAGTFHGVDPTLSLAVAKAESDFQTDAVSRDGHSSKGLFQLLDTTGREMLTREELGAEPYDPFNPHLNAHLGVGYLKHLFEAFTTSTELKGKLKTVPAKSAADLEKLAIAAFNAGEGNVARAQERAMALGKNPAEFTSVEPHLPQSTRAYVQRVLKLRSEMQPETSFDGTV